MHLIKWNDEKMSIGIDLIDSQHKTLMDLINNIMLSIENNNQVYDLEKLINDAINYSKYHFSAEEKLFEELSLDKDDIEEHKKEHQNFIDKVTDLYSELNKNVLIKNKYEIEMLTELFNFLSNWLVKHIVLEDKEFLAKKVSE